MKSSNFCQIFWSNARISFWGDSFW